MRDPYRIDTDKGPLRLTATQRAWVDGRWKRVCDLIEGDVIAGTDATPPEKLRTVQTVTRLQADRRG